MKKTICCILFASTAFAQTAPATVEITPAATQVQVVDTEAPKGDASEAPMKVAKSNAWKGWVFVGVSVAIAAGAIVAVAVSQGSSQH